MKKEYDFSKGERGKFYNNKARFNMKDNKNNLYAEFFDPGEKFQLEPRAFCYDLASDLIAQAKSKSPKNWYNQRETIQGVLLLLYTWNFAAQKTKALNYDNVGGLLKDNKELLRKLEKRSIQDDEITWENIKEDIEKVFDSFKTLFGQTGASKALSLLNPNLFVMWDTNIRKELNKELIPKINNGKSSKHYITYLEGIRKIIDEYNIATNLPPGSIVAKKIDEYNYVKIVMGL